MLFFESGNDENKYYFCLNDKGKRAIFVWFGMTEAFVVTLPWDVWQLIVAQTDCPLTVMRIALTCRRLWRRFGSCDLIAKWKRMSDAERFLQAARQGHRKLVELMITNGFDDWNWGLCGAAMGGHREMVELMIGSGADDWNRGLYYAAFGAHGDIMELMIVNGADDWDRALNGAALGGHRDIVQLMISKGANDWSWGIYYATAGGHKELKEYFEGKMREN